MAPTLLLTDDELRALTGYTQPARIVAALLEQGFYRARRSAVTGKVILERAHYDAVSAGAVKPAHEPKVRPPPSRRVQHA
jgi:hypothetical protein